METRVLSAVDAIAMDWDFDFAIDTALSWEGDFPPLGAGDFVVSMVSTDGGTEEAVLVSRRYTSAVDAENAASIAVDAYQERHGCDAWASIVTEIR